MKIKLWILMIGCIHVGACTNNPKKESGFTDPVVGPDEADTGESNADESAPRTAYEITPGVGIGPVELGGTYGQIVDVYGEPDALIDYYRIFFATWLELGVEVVVGSANDEAPEPDSVIISVGTRLPTGFSGPVIPGMTRAEADAIVGPCEDVIDDLHCYHSAGLYLGYAEDGSIKTVAVHRPYTPQPNPPEMVPALGLGGLQ